MLRRSPSVRVESRGDRRPDGIVHVREAARLPAVAEQQSERLVAQQLDHEDLPTP